MRVAERGQAELPARDTPDPETHPQVSIKHRMLADVGNTTCPSASERRARLVTSRRMRAANASAIPLRFSDPPRWLDALLTRLDNESESH